MQTVIMAGGTGGHIFPALAVAKEFKEQNIQVTWLGVKDSMEAQLIPKYNLPIELIDFHGFMGKTLGTKFKTPFNLLKAIWQTIRILQKIKPQVVVGFGGYVSLPGALAAWLLNIPLMIHEQNAIAGKTNKILARVAKVILEGYPNTFSQRNAIYVGNPIREELQLNKVPDFNKAQLNILVLGGSRGALAINKLLPEALALTDVRFKILHQTGTQHFEHTKKMYQGCLHDYTVVPFIEDMVSAYQFADLVIARSGASTVAELIANQLPSILIPFPYAIYDHQYYNAEILVEHKAAIRLRQEEITPGMLKNILEKFNAERSLLTTMSAELKKLHKMDVAQNIVKYCLKEVIV